MELFWAESYRSQKQRSQMEEIAAAFSDIHLPADFPGSLI